MKIPIINCRDTKRVDKKLMIAKSLKTANYMINAANQVVIFFDKPDNLTLEEIKQYLTSLTDKPEVSMSGCGDPL